MHEINSYYYELFWYFGMLNSDVIFRK